MRWTCIARQARAVRAKCRLAAFDNQCEQASRAKGYTGLALASYAPVSARAHFICFAPTIEDLRIDVVNQV